MTQSQNPVEESIYWELSILRGFRLLQDELLPNLVSRPIDQQYSQLATSWAAGNITNADDTMTLGWFTTNSKVEKSGGFIPAKIKCMLFSS